MTVIAELDQIIQILEATIPANPNSPANERLAERLRRSLAKYFKALEDAFPYGQVDRLYYKYVKEQLGSETRDMLDPLLATLDANLTTEVSGHLTTIYFTGSTEMITWGKTKGGVPIAYEGPPISQAVDWAKKEGARLVTQMDDETKRRLSKLISDGIANKRGVPGLARDIRKDFENMTRYRSQLIAKTETRQALFQASHDRMVDMGIDGKEWVLGAGGAEGNCEYCQANAAVGVVPVNQEFPNPEGDIHPGCLLPDNMVLPLGLLASSRAMYEGIAIELKTRKGHQLTVTPNHMILTPKGFIKADALHEGDDVIDCLDSQRIASIINPNNDQMPTRIQEIWDSLLVSEGSTSISMPTSPIDFHGDAIGFNGNVDIIFSASFLRSYNNTFLSDKIYKLALSRRLSGATILSNNSPRLQFFNSRMPTLSSDMGIGSNGVAILDRHPRHSQRNSLAHGTRSDTKLEEVSVENTPVYTDLSSKFLFRFASQITLDEIVKIRDFYFSGHVYDLQSLESLYISTSKMSNNGGLILKNCTCAIAPARLPK